MKFTTKTDYFENFFFFLCTLAVTKNPSQKIYKKNWIKKINPISNSKKYYLKKFREIYIKNQFLKYTIAAHYNSQQRHWVITSAEDQKIINNIFNNWNDIFLNFYNRELPLLKQWKKILDQQLKDNKIIQPILKTTSKLYNTPIKNTEVKIFLLPSIKNYTSGGVVITEKKLP